MREIIDLPYSNEFAENRKMDIYLPDENTKEQCIFFIHGGGWHAGSKAQWTEVAKYFCAQGYVCCSTGYRLAPQFKHPCQLEDVNLAIEYIMQRAEEFGFSQKKIILVGSSAGGHLAAMLGVSSLAKPQGVVCYCPVTMVGNIAEDAWLEDRVPNFAEEFIGKNEMEAPELYREASPYEKVKGGEPPFLFIHGDNDNTVPLTQSLKMNERLHEFGVLSKVQILPGVGHGFGYGVTKPAQIKAIEYVEEFLEELNHTN